MFRDFYGALLLWILTFLSIYAQISANLDWAYGSEEVKAWGKTFPKCDMRRQSPINFDKSQIEYDTELGEIHRKKYNVPTTMSNVELLNNDHTIVINIPNSQATISGGGLWGEYRLAQFHYHWGSTNDVGSEHTIGGKEYPLEMHLVHYSTKYDDLTSAANASGNSLAVMGFLYEVSSETSSIPTSLTDRFSDVANLIVTETDKSLSVDIATFSLDTIVPEDLGAMYRYHGSLTIPPCHESVIWSVFPNILKVSQAQMEALRGLSKTVNGVKSSISDNYRPPQPLYGRVVKSNMDTTSAADYLVQYNLLLLMSFIPIAKLFL